MLKSWRPGQEGGLSIGQLVQQSVLLAGVPGFAFISHMTHLKTWNKKSLMRYMWLHHDLSHYVITFNMQLQANMYALYLEKSYVIISNEISYLYAFKSICMTHDNKCNKKYELVHCNLFMMPASKVCLFLLLLSCI